MDAGESLDREVIVERAEALRSWLGGLSLPGRTMGALNRELAGIIDNDPGGYIDGQRPLAGLTVAEFVAELGRPGAGAVGSVRSVGETAIRDLRAAVASPEGEAADGAPDATPEAWQEYTGGADEAQAPPVEVRNGAAKPRRPRARKAAPDAEPASATSANGVVGPGQIALAAELSNGASHDAPAADALAVLTAPKRRGRPPRQAAEAVAPAVVAEEAPAPKRRGRPPRQAAAEAAPAAVAEEAPAPKRRGRPPRQTFAPIAALAPVPAQPAAVAPAAVADPTLEQLARLWPSLHPQARRAVMLYTSTLLAEAPYFE
jgi:hypothetical protein